MKAGRRLLASALAFVAAGGLAWAGWIQSSETRPPIDRRSGLISAEGLELVKMHCLECHTARLIIQTRGRREDWIGMIRWMQETQDLAILPPETEKVILDYLVANYGIEDRVLRRQPLAPELLPPPVGSAAAGRSAQ